MKLVFLHGSGATPDSFNYIESNFEHDKIFLTYENDAGFINNVNSLYQNIDFDDDIFFISHSLGGVYALHLMAKKLKKYPNSVKGSVSLATPFGGSDSATMLGILYPNQLYRDIHPYATPIIMGHKISINIPWTAVVTTSGASHLMIDDNDGVVTKKSMIDRSGVTFIESKTNHFEVMVRKETVNIIQDAILKV